MTVDESNMLQVLHEFTKNIKRAADLSVRIDLKDLEVTKIMIAGMGGSGFTGDLLKTYLVDTKIPVFVNKTYTLPQYVDKNTLLFVISYSGNTEETISCFRSAIRRSIPVISISSGGKLHELAGMHKTNHITIPSGIQPRLSVPFLFIPVLSVLQQLGLIDNQGEHIKKALIHLEDHQKTIEESGKKLAQKTKGIIPIIYASQKWFAMAEKWKTDLNENAKSSAFYNMFPEFNHNEICSYQNPLTKYHVIIINDTDDHERIKVRIEAFKKVMRQYDAQVTELAITGNNYLTRLLSTLWMGQYFAYYLALEYDTDPTPVHTIEEFKKEIA